MAHKCSYVASPFSREEERNLGKLLNFTVTWYFQSPIEKLKILRQIKYSHPPALPFMSEDTLNKQLDESSNEGSPRHESHSPPPQNNPWLPAPALHERKGTSSCKNEPSGSYDVKSLLQRAAQKKMTVDDQLHMLIHSTGCKTCFDYMEHIVTTFHDNTDHIEQELLSHWEQQLYQWHKKLCDDAYHQGIHKETDHQEEEANRLQGERNA